jgi:hypothetical protein
LIKLLNNRPYPLLCRFYFLFILFLFSTIWISCMYSTNKYSNHSSITHYYFHFFPFSLSSCWRFFLSFFSFLLLFN